MIKKSLCIFLCAVLLVFCLVPAQPPAEAVALTLTAGAAIILELLFGIGCTVATIELASHMINDFTKTYPDIMDEANRIAAEVENGTNPDRQPDPNKPGMIPFVPTDSDFIGKAINALRDMFGKKTGENNFVIEDTINGVMADVVFVNKTTFANSFDAYSCANYDLSLYSSEKPLNFLINGKSYYFFATKISPIHYAFNTSGSGSFDLSIYIPSGVSIKSIRLGFHKGVISNSTYLIPFLAAEYYDTNNNINYYYDVYDDYEASHVKYRCIPYDDTLVTYPIITYPYTYDPVYAPSTVRDTMISTIEKDGVLYFPNTEFKTDEDLKISQEQLIETIGIGDTLKDIKEQMPKPEEDMSVPSMPDITWKFPFCVPFDLIALVTAFNAPPKDPIWEIPFKMTSLGIDEKITLDLTQFEPVTKVLRATTTIFFILGLVVVTRKMIKG